jgi:bifunctional DNA-binding transcriptional regulator/antitoxin component of YhaV-PrlF toxin-antitoxin module
MNKTVTVSAKRQVVIPRDYYEGVKLKPGAALRVVQIGNSLVLTPVSLPTQKEFKTLLRMGGSVPDEDEQTDDQIHAALTKVRAKAKTNGRRP